MTIPLRIQRSRAKGWRMPENTVCVTRPGPWGNPYKVGDAVWDGVTGRRTGSLTAQATVAKFARDLPYLITRTNILTALRGKNLACWCKLCPEHKDGKPLGVVCEACEPCHVDVLGPLANGPVCEPIQPSDHQTDRSET